MFKLWRQRSAHVRRSTAHWSALHQTRCGFLIQSIAATEAYIAACTDLDFNFAVGRERRFMLDACDCSREFDAHTLLDHVWNYDYVAELQPYQLR